MTREEAKAEINKVFEPAFANYIITALTEGATPSERKAGRWIGVNPLVDSVECSACGYQLCSYELRTPYCPWCGAKMEGAEG